MNSRSTGSFFVASVESLVLSIVATCLFSATIPNTPDRNGFVMWAFATQLSLLLLCLLIQGVAVAFVKRESVGSTSDMQDRIVWAAGNVYCACVYHILLTAVLAVLFLATVRDDTNALWREAVLGPVAATSSSTPVIGSINLGAVMAFLTVALLLSVYAAYTVTPVGKNAPLFLDWRMFACTNLGISLLPLSIKAWGECYTDPGQCLPL